MKYFSLIIDMSFSNSKLKRNVFYGNIINWSKASWDATYMTKYDSSYSEVCKESKSEIIFFVAKQKLDLNSGTTVCNAIKGSLNVIIDQENQKSVIEAMNEANCEHGKFQLIDWFCYSTQTFTECKNFLIDFLAK